MEIGAALMWASAALGFIALLGICVWLRDHGDYHMEQLFSPDGPFGSSETTSRPDEPLPLEAAPEGLFPDERIRP